MLLLFSLSRCFFYILFRFFFCLLILCRVYDVFFVCILTHRHPYSKSEQIFFSTLYLSVCVQCVRSLCVYVCMLSTYLELKNNFFWFGWFFVSLYLPFSLSFFFWFTPNERKKPKKKPNHSYGTTQNQSFIHSFIHLFSQSVSH